VEQWGPPLWGVRVSAASGAADDWNLAGHEGGMVTVGRGAGVSGRGADLFIIDDPLADVAEAASDTIREQLWDWYRSTAYTRLHKDGLVVLIQTRWRGAVPQGGRRLVPQGGGAIPGLG
jgi:hypothetical protein